MKREKYEVDDVDVAELKNIDAEIDNLLKIKDQKMKEVDVAEKPVVVNPVVLSEEDKLLKALNMRKVTLEHKVKSADVPRRQVADMLVKLHRSNRRNLFLLSVLPVMMFLMGLFYNDVVSIGGLILSLVIACYSIFMVMKANQSIKYLVFKYNLSIPKVDVSNVNRNEGF